MNTKFNSQEELKQLNIKDGYEYVVEYLNKDYFNGENTIERSKAKAFINNGEILFIVVDPYGMERYINEVKVLE